MNSAFHLNQHLLAARRLRRRALRSVLRRVRSIRHAIVLMAVLALSIGEPLMCVVHCDLWLPMFYQASGIHTHQHGHTPGMLMTAEGEPTPQLAHEAAADGLIACHPSLNSGGATAVPIPPSPIHEISIALLPTLALVWAREHYRHLPGLSPPESPLPSPFRPPILPTA